MGQLTPKSKTMADLKALNLTSRRKSVAKRQLLTCNVLMNEIHKAKRVPEKKKCTTFMRIFWASWPRSTNA